MPHMTLPRIGMDMDALLTQQHGMVAWLEHLRAEVVRCTLFFHLASPLLFSPLFSPFSFLLGFWVYIQHHSSPPPPLLPPRFFSLSGFETNPIAACATA